MEFIYDITNHILSFFFWKSHCGRKTHWLFFFKQLFQITVLSRLCVKVMTSHPFSNSCKWQFCNTEEGKKTLQGMLHKHISYIAILKSINQSIRIVRDGKWFSFSLGLWAMRYFLILANVLEKQQYKTTPSAKGEIS